MSLVSDQEKIELLFKQFTGVANADKTKNFASESFKFSPYVMNESIFSEDINQNLIDISFSLGPGIVQYGCSALDSSYGPTSLGQSFQITPNLTYYHRLKLEKADGSDYGYYSLDSSGNNILKDTIPFLFDDKNNSFAQLLYVAEPAPNPTSFVGQSLGAFPLAWLMDYQSGFIELFGEPIAYPNGIQLLPTQELRLSFIKYTGKKGAAGGDGEGGDSSFNDVDISGDLILKGQNLLNVVEYDFYSKSTTSTLFSPSLGSTTGYFKIASVDNLKSINLSKPNMAETVTQGTFTFYTRVNFEDSGYNSANKLQFNSEITFGINQVYQNAVSDDECFANTHYCLSQGGQLQPFDNFYMVRNSITNKYELYLHFNEFGAGSTSNRFRNKIINLTITLKGNENLNPINTDLSGNNNGILNWELEPSLIFQPSLPSTTNDFICRTINITNNTEKIWSGSTAPVINENVVSTFGNNILNRYIYGDGTSDFTNNTSFIAQAGIGASGEKQMSLNGEFRLLARSLGPGTIYTHEIVFKAGVQTSGAGTSTSIISENTFLNVISNTFSHNSSPLISNIYLRGTKSSGSFFYYITIDRNTSVATAFYLDIQITNNNENSLSSGNLTDVRYWGIGIDRGATGLTTFIKKVNTEKNNFTGFNNDRLIANVIAPSFEPNSAFITGDEDVLSTSIRNNTLTDGSDNLITKINSGINIIDANTPQGTGGGLKIFNSGGSYPNDLSYPKISLIPFKNSGGAGTLGNPTHISVNDDESTTFQGSGNLSIFNGQQNFGNFNIFQGNGTTLSASNVIHSDHRGGTEYQLSLNNSRNDTDVIINTPDYNIYDTPNTPAMVADSGDNKITFNAPVIFNNDVTSNSIALMEEFTFNTSNISPDEWFTLAQTGDGSDRNKLRSDGKFILEDRLGSHHHTLIFKAGAKFSSGIYINVLESSWFDIPRIKALRIAYNSTYDGSVLQAQLNSDSASQSTSNLKLRIYQNRNNQGWFSDISGSPSAEMNPTCYVVTNSSNGFGTLYPNFRQSGNVIYDPNGRNTTQTTTNNFVVQQSTLTVENSTGVNIECNQSPGNIILDTVGGTIAPAGATRGITLVAHNGIYMEANNTTSSGTSITFNSKTSGTNSFMKWSSNGLSVGAKDITNIKNLYGDNSSGNMIIRANNNGVNSNSDYVVFESPVTIPSANGSLCVSSLTNASEGTYVYNSDNNTLMYKTDSSKHPQTSSNISTCMSCPVILWNWTENYVSFISPNFTTPSWLRNYNKAGTFSPFGFPPSHVSPPAAGGGELPLMYDKYKPPYAGFLTALTWNWAYYSAAAIQIRRSYGFGMPNTRSSRLIVRCVVKNPGQTTGTSYTVGYMLIGPGPGGALGLVTSSSASGDKHMNFTVNPRTNLIPFEKDAEINFELFFDNAAIFSDSIKVDIDYAATSNTTVASVIPYFHFYVET
jgi:hypothetical protein